MHGEESDEEWKERFAQRTDADWVQNAVTFIRSSIENKPSRTFVSEREDFISTVSPVCVGGASA